MLNNRTCASRTANNNAIIEDNFREMPYTDFDLKICMIISVISIIFAVPSIYLLLQLKN